MAENKVNVWFNDGRWITQCPDCGSKTEIRPRKKKIKQLKIKWYCGNDYPGKIQRQLRIMADKSIGYVYSREAQKAAATKAFNDGKIHTAIFPDDWQEAERLLRMRKIIHQHYLPHEISKKLDRPETAADLAVENDNDPLLAYIAKDATEAVIQALTVSGNEVESNLQAEIVIIPIPAGIYKELQ